MSQVSTQQDLVAERVAEALRNDFPKWVAAKEKLEAEAAQKEEEEEETETEFFLVSNWAFHPGGLQEFTSELQNAFPGLEVSYNLETSWMKIKCLTADEAEVMLACQLVLDGIARRELENGLPFSDRIFPYHEGSVGAHDAGTDDASTPDISEVMLATAPPEIQGAACRALWWVPEGLLGRGPNPFRLATAEVLAKLQHITGCALALESNGLAVFVGGESLQEINVVIRKLDTLAEHAGSPYQADTRCESFIYAEDKQNSPAAFTYMVHGEKAIPKTFFLDRAKYELAEGVSVYGKMVEQGVVVVLPHTSSQPTKGPGHIRPAISPRDRKVPYKAFSSQMWHYEPKSRSYGSDEVSFNIENNPWVASWVTQVPKPECNQSWELSGGPSVNLDDENVRRVSPMASYPLTETVVEQSSVTPNNLEMSSAEQGLIGFDQQQTEELSANILKESERTSITQSGAEVPQHPPASEIEREDPFIKLWKGAQIGELRVEPSVTPPPRRSTMRQQAGRRYDGFQVPGCQPSHEQVHRELDPDPELIQAITKKLVRMMGSLKTFTGKVSLKAELGRLCLMKVNHNHVYLKGSAYQDKVKSLQDIKEILDRHHIKPRHALFARFLTGDGGDANYIAFAENSSGERLWTPTARHTVYEIHCRVKTADEKYHKFTLEVDAKEFTYRIYKQGGDSCAVFVHCPKRVWDFQVTLTKLQDLGLTYGDFAEDLINSMRVINQDSGIPLLEFIVKGVYQAEIQLVRTRNVASYARKEGSIQPFFNAYGSKSSATSVLEICEVHDMAPKTISRENDNVTILFKQYGGNKELGHLPIWYEVSLQSKAINEALQQNRDLEIGEEVSWTPQQLQKAGAFDEIITSAMEAVKNIDGIGYWGDNCQNAKIHKMPPSGTETYLQHPTSKPPV